MCCVRKSLYKRISVVGRLFVLFDFVIPIIETRAFAKFWLQQGIISLVFVDKQKKAT